MAISRIHIGAFVQQKACTCALAREDNLRPDAAQMSGVRPVSERTTKSSPRASLLASYVRARLEKKFCDAKVPVLSCEDQGCLSLVLLHPVRFGALA